MIDVAPPFGNISVPSLRHAFRAAAMLDAIVEPDPGYRYFRYRPRWLAETDLAEIDDGSGNNLAAIFLGTAVLIKGFDHESELSPFPEERESVWQGIYDEVPSAFAHALAQINPGERVPLDTTFCIWRTESDKSWKCGAITIPPGCDDGGFHDLLSLIPLNASAYKLWADAYYERGISPQAIAAVYEGEPVNPALLQTFGASERIVQISEDAVLMGWPVRKSS